MHLRMMAGGLNVPPTVILTALEAAQWQPTPEQKAMLGEPFVVKPSLGYGRRGVILNATGPADLKRSLDLWPDPHLLLQQRIQSGQLGGDPAYFRVYHVFGRTWCCWWNCFTDRYRELTQEEETAFRLAPLRDITLRIARLTDMQMFSTEIALNKAEEFVVIDYVNDQIHLLTQSSNPAIGMPDRVVGEIADALVAQVRRWVRPEGKASQHA
jgi:hypothetical protein